MRCEDWSEKSLVRGDLPWQGVVGFSVSNSILTSPKARFHRNQEQGIHANCNYQSRSPSFDHFIQISGDTFAGVSHRSCEQLGAWYPLEADHKSALFEPDIWWLQTFFLIRRSCTYDSMHILSRVCVILCPKRSSSCQQDGSQKERETKEDVHQSIRDPSVK